MRKLLSIALAIALFAPEVGFARAPAGRRHGGHRGEAWQTSKGGKEIELKPARRHHKGGKHRRVRRKQW